MRAPARRMILTLITAVLLGSGSSAQAGPQMYEPMSESVRAALYASISDQPPVLVRKDDDYRAWRVEMSQRLKRWLPNESDRLDLLDSVYYEATRAGLDPQLVLGLIQVESGFRKYAVSSAGARGYMQIMPFWIDVIGRPADNLFHRRTNLRYGCTILRHYLDIEEGNLFRALGRYNGSLGKAVYPEKVRSAWEGEWAFANARPRAPAHLAANP